MSPRPLQSAWVLHTRPYRESSLLIECFSEQDGRFCAVARGVRGNGQRARQWRALLRPFVPLALIATGRHELKTLQHVEAAASPFWLQGEALYCGLYANELLWRLLPPGEAHAELFLAYARLLADLELIGGEGYEPLLRHFEWSLLTEMGLCPEFFRDAVSGESIQPDCRYRYVPEVGFVHWSGSPETDDYRGAELLAMAARDWSESATRRAAKRLNRGLIQAQLGGRVLLSRHLFRGGESIPSSGSTDV